MRDGFCAFMAAERAFVPLARRAVIQGSEKKQKTWLRGSAKALSRLARFANCRIETAATIGAPAQCRLVKVRVATMFAVIGVSINWDVRIRT